MKFPPFYPGVWCIKTGHFVFAIEQQKANIFLQSIETELQT